MNGNKLLLLRWRTNTILQEWPPRRKEAPGLAVSKVSIGKVHVYNLDFFFSLKLLFHSPLYTPCPPSHTHRVFQIFINWVVKREKYLVQRESNAALARRVGKAPNKKVEDANRQQTQCSPTTLHFCFSPRRGWLLGGFPGSQVSLVPVGKETCRTTGASG